MTDGPTAVIAFGRCDHGDDAAGLMLADILEQHRPGRLTVVRAPAARDEVLDVLQVHDTVYAVDTIRTGGSPGTVRRIDPRDDRLPASYPHGGQQVSLVDVVDAAESGRTDLVVVFVRHRGTVVHAAGGCLTGGGRSRARPRRQGPRRARRLE